MGYLSDAGLCLRKADFERLQELVKEKGNSNINLFLFGHSKMIGYTNVVVLKWNSIKWGAFYEEVEFLSDFLFQLGMEGKPYRFIRIGENWEDNEFDTNWGEDEYLADAEEIAETMEFNRSIDIAG